MENYYGFKNSNYRFHYFFFIQTLVLIFSTMEDDNLERSAVLAENIHMQLTYTLQYIDRVQAA